MLAVRTRYNQMERRLRGSARQLVAAYNRLPRPATDRPFAFTVALIDEALPAIDREVDHIIASRVESEYAGALLGQRKELRALTRLPLSATPIEPAGFALTPIGERRYPSVARFIARLVAGDPPRTVAADFARAIKTSRVHQAERVLRTESRRAFGAGNQEAAERVRSETGLEMRKRWLATGGARTRASHAALDGQEVELSEFFVIPAGPNAGARAPQQAAFSIAAEDINCRCVVRYIPLGD